MIHRKLIRARSAVAAVVLLAGGPIIASGQSLATAKCGVGTGRPALGELQSLVKRYYPGLVTRTKTSGKVAVGFVFDAQCTVLRHAASFLPDTAWSEDLITTVFPDIRRQGQLAGIADGVPPTGRQGTLDQYLVATYIVLPGRGEKRPSER